MSGLREPPWLVKYHAVGLAKDRNRLLKDIDLEVVPGERLVILGPNGAGKTLLMHAGHGLIEPTQGRIERGGTLREAMVFQRPVLLRRSVISNVLYAIENAQPVHGERSRASREARSVAALQLVGLETLAHRPARVLSGGEQQRVALARAAALQPDLVWLDEPTANLDPASTQGIEQIVIRMSQEGAACVMTTHDVGQARRLAQRVVLMAAGRIIECTPADRFFEQPSTEAGRRYLRGELLNG